MIIIYQNQDLQFLKRNKWKEQRYLTYQQSEFFRGCSVIGYIEIFVLFTQFFNQTKERLERDMTYTGKPSPHTIENEGLDNPDLPFDQSDLILKLHHSQIYNKQLKDKQSRINEQLQKAQQEVKKKNKQIKKLEKTVKNLSENLEKTKEDLETIKLSRKAFNYQNLIKKNQALQDKLYQYQAINEQYQELKMNQLLKKEQRKIHETPMATDTGSRYQAYYAQQLKKQNHCLKLQLQKLREMYKDVLLQFQSQRMIIQNFNKMQMQSENQEYEKITSASENFEEQTFEYYSMIKKSKRKRRIQRIERKKIDQKKESMNEKVMQQLVIETKPRKGFSGWRNKISVFSKNLKCSHQMIALIVFLLVLLSLFC